MKREAAYLAILLILAMFLVVVFTGSNQKLSLTGKVIDGNETTNETTNETAETNETTNETVETNETANETVETNQTQETNQTGETNQTANETCTEDWSCLEWNDCLDGNQIRTCTDANTCDTELNKPIETQSCEIIEEVEEESTVQVTLEESRAATQEEQTVETPVESEAPEPQPAPAPEPQPAPAPEPQPEETVSVFTGQIIEATNETCYGCVLNDNCYEINKRKKGQYCGEDGNWINQTAFNMTCSADFECASYNCGEGSCDGFNLLKVLKNWFKNLFTFKLTSGGAMNNSTNITS